MNLRLLTVILLYSLLSASGFSQDTTAVKQLFDSSDSARIVSSEIQDQDIKPEIEFTVTEAMEYLQKNYSLRYGGTLRINCADQLKG